MRQYDGLFIFTPRETADNRKRQISNLENLIKKHEGTIIQKSEWGDKLMGYPIRKHKEGYFLVLEFTMNPAQMTSFRNALELQDDLLKLMITVYNAKKQKPAPEKSRPAAVRATR